MSDAECAVCFHRCRIPPGGEGFCGARVNRGGASVSASYGALTALALDPIEKKPLRRYKPGSRILSAGSFGCNFRCPFCQNCEISAARASSAASALWPRVTPEELVRRAEALVPQGNIGLAYTYNEPLVGFEFVRDAARLARARGLDNILVTNGCAAPEVFAEVLPLMDALNIDLKAFTPEFYGRISGSLECVKENIARAQAARHVELTCLVIPGENDTDAEMRAMCAFIASLSPDIPLHITRFFPRFRYASRSPTPPETLFRLKRAAEERLTYVFLGNV